MMDRLPASQRWLSLVGIGEDGLEGLTSAARTLVEDAEVLVGGARHLAKIPPEVAPQAERTTWPTPLTALIDTIVGLRGRRVCVLATGDPLCYGAGVTLARHVARSEMTVLPALSAFSLACARLGWPLAETETLTLHGRPLELLHPFVQPGARLLILAHDGATPRQVARLLAARGYGESRLTALAHMGGEAEASFEGTAATWPEETVPDFHTLAVACVAAPDAPLRPRVPGLPDEAFVHDGQMTKREVRAITLAKLGPTPGARLWDVGAGCGSVSVEWMRAAERAPAWAIEPKAERREAIAANASALGTPRLKIVAGRAPDALAELPPPDAVFVGGGLATPGLAEACWNALSPGGRLVANAVTLEGEARLAELHATHGGELVRLAVSRAEPIGPYRGWRAGMPVTQWSVTR
jgi:precorrin-6Y C5,15-methyltransferase (decarboxylating)